MSRKRLLIVGAGGFLGSHFCDYFLERAYSVAAIGQGSALERQNRLAILAPMRLPDAAIVEVLRQFAPDVLIYAAGTASVPQSFQAPYDDFQRAVNPLAFVLEMLKIHAPQCRLIFLSSAALYGNSNQLPIDEGVAIAPVSPYGYHKQICEVLIEEYTKLYGLQATTLRIFSAYGERLKRQVIYDLCQKLFNPQIDRIHLHGTGAESRDFIHAWDVAGAIECMIQSQALGVYNVGTGQQTTIAQLVQLLTRLSGQSKPYHFNQLTRSGDPINVEADITKLKHLGFAPSVTLVEGLQKYLSWFTAEKDRP
jgi:UDP-glucose 4-epimerase